MARTLKNFRLSDQAVAKLKLLHQQTGLSATALVELGIFRLEACHIVGKPRPVHKKKEQ
jgi:hypothetical protein